MNLWKRLFGRPATPPPPVKSPDAPPRPGMVKAGSFPATPPADAQRLGDTFMIGFATPEAYTLVDLDTFDFQYGEARRQLPDPAQADLDQLWPRVDRVRVRAGGMVDGKALPWPVLVDTTDAGALNELAARLAIRQDLPFVHCGCLGGPTFQLFAGQEVVATLGLHHGESIRWSTRWRPDAPLRSDRIGPWLVDNGVDPALLEALYSNPFQLAAAPAATEAECLSRTAQKLFLAEIRFEQGAVAEALALCKEVIVREPMSAAGYVARGSIRKRTGDLVGALSDLTFALQYGGPSAELLFSCGVMLSALDRNAEAVSELSAALDLDPAHTNAWNSRGIVWRTVGDLTRAKADLDQAVRLAPGWHIPYVNRAQVQVERGDSAGGLEDYRSAIDLLTARGRPDERSLLGAMHHNRGLLWGELGKPAEAEADRAAASALRAAALGGPA